jgi:Cobalamin synthesis protein cobW C-terminal domain
MVAIAFNTDYFFCVRRCLCLVFFVYYRPETEEYGISSFVFRARKPFHPSRLMEFITEKLGDQSDDDNEEEEDDDIDEKDCVTALGTKSAQKAGDNNSDENNNNGRQSCVVRSKGFFWLASRSSEMMIWSQAGGLFQLSPGGKWWIDTPKTAWPTDDDSVTQINADWDPVTGDRRQELVFIGTDLDKEDMVRSLNECLLDEKEMAEGPDAWIQLDDPFPESPELELEEGYEADLEGDAGAENSDHEEVTMVIGKSAKSLTSGR